MESYRQLMASRGGKFVFFRDRSPSWLFSTECSVLKTYILDNTKRTQRVVFMYLFTYIEISLHMYVILFKEKEATNLKEEAGKELERKRDGWS